jgi:hypothetical protein
MIINEVVVVMTGHNFIPIQKVEKYLKTGILKIGIGFLKDSQHG